MPKIRLRPRPAPDPVGGAYSALPDPLAGFKGPILLRGGEVMGGKERTGKGREGKGGGRGKGERERGKGRERIIPVLRALNTA